MTNLIYNSEILNVNESIEIIKSENFGLDVVIINKDGSIEQRNNCHEVHHLYNTPFEPSIAFESDFHGTGGTRKIESIQSVIIYDAVKMHDSY